MQRKEILAAISQVTDAIAKSGVIDVIRPSRPEKSGPRDTGEQLRALRNYSIIAASYKPSARALARIFNVEPLEDPNLWVQLVNGGGGENANLVLFRAVRTLQSEVPKILALLMQESVQSSSTLQGDAASSADLDAVRITFV